MGEVTNSDFCESALGTLAELHYLGLLSAPSPRGRQRGRTQYVPCDALAPLPEWQGMFDMVIEKGLADTLLFGDGEDAALERAVRYAASVATVLRPGGLFLQVSDAPLALRREMLEALWASPGSTWEFTTHATGDASLSILVARKLHGDSPACVQ